MLQYPLLQKLLFKLPPECSHHLGLQGLHWLDKLHLLKDQRIMKPTKVMGLTFDNPVGLAAGLDKDGIAIDALAKLGFGFIEVGTVTPMPQPGNPKPRLFRLPQEQALINRFGFNNCGLEQFIKNIKKSQYTGVLGINIGKNFDTPLDRAVEDYLIGLKAVYPYASYIVINISSPNTQSLRELQFGALLEDLLSNMKASQTILSQTHQKWVPLVVKISPDLSEHEMMALAEQFLNHKVEGVIATNTSISRLGIKGRFAKEAGGLSGQPIFHSSTQVLKAFSHALKGQIPLIGTGGIMNREQAKEKFEVGARLIQLYSGFIYHGPELINDILQKTITTS